MATKRTPNNLTDTYRLILLLVKHKQVSVRELILLLDRVHSMVYFYLEMCRGLDLITHDYDTARTWRITPAGDKAIEGYTVVIEGGKARLGKVERFE